MTKDEIDILCESLQSLDNLEFWVIIHPKA
jgi:hypothetical protein